MGLKIWDHLQISAQYIGLPFDVKSFLETRPPRADSFRPAAADADYGVGSSMPRS